MKKPIFAFAAVLIALVYLLIHSCAPTQPEILKIDSRFGKYVSGYSSGVISRTESIRIELSNSVPDLEKMSEKRLNELIRLEPEVEGKLVAIGDRIVDFVPEEPLPSGQFYTVYFDLYKVAEVEKGLEEFIFQFSTKRQEIEVEVNGLTNYDSYSTKYQQLTGSLETRDWEDTTLLKKVLSIELDGKKQPFRWRTYSYNSELYFVVDSIERLEREQELVVKWDGTPINSLSRGQEKIKVSSLGDFTVSTYNVHEDEDQSVEIHFSEPILAGQDLNGIIELEGADEVSFKITRNTVEIFLSNRIIGEHKLKISQGLRNMAGYRMKNPFEVELTFHEPNPMVRLIGSGSILPNSQGLIFPFEAISLKSVDVRIIRIFEKNVHHFLQVNNLTGEDELTRFGEIIAERNVTLSKDTAENLKVWKTYVLDLERFIKAEPGAIYRVQIKFERKDAACGCADEEEETPEEPGFTFDDDPAAWNEWNWHSWGFDGYSDWGGYGDEDPCDHSYYRGRAVSRNILASNIGMIYKLDENKTAHITLSDMVTTEPMAFAQVDFYDYNRKELASVTTDARGMATVQFSKKPFLMIAKKGSQRGYMKLEDAYSNSLSKFDVDGEYIQKGVKGYLYAERGVWRPGDSLYINFMLHDRLHKFPKTHPVTFEFADPNGNIIHKVVTSKQLNGVYDFRTSTGDDAITGTYYAYVHVGNKTYSKACKIETIKPNRLKVLLDTQYGKSKDSCELKVSWLHGASASKLKVDIEARFEPVNTTFEGYAAYTFDSPIRSSQSTPFSLYVGQLDVNGIARFANVISDLKETAGMLRARYMTRVYEKSGEMSIDYTYSMYSPYSYYVGLKAPEGKIYDRTLDTDKQQRIDFVRVNKEGQPAASGKLHVRVYKLNWDWWYDGEDELASFKTHNSALQVTDTVLNVKNGKTSLNYYVEGAKYGKYLFTVTDEKGHQSGKVLKFDLPYWSRENVRDGENASMLSFATDKESYVAGEMIKMTFPSPSNGRALVSVETSEKVLDQFWIETKKGETNYAFPATAAMSPNAYLHVTLIQPHHATTNDLPIRMYGIVPVKVDDPGSHLHPLINMKDKIRPESTTSITVREEQGRKMTYTLAIVDDGLLDLTHFETPEPWNSFYAREALGVQTWDMYDDVIGAYAGKMDRLLSIGGDGLGNRGNGPKASRFKPMVVHLGPFELPAGGSRTHKVEIPNYVGSVRVMVVARDNESYGRAQKTVTVKKPVMALATMPRVLGPGEEFSIPVDVFAMEDFVKNVEVKLETNEFFEVLDQSEKQIQFSKVGDEILYFKIRTKKQIGIGKVKVLAKCGKESAYQEIEIDIRPSNPVEYETEEVVLEPGEERNVTLLMDGMAGTNRGIMETSTLPAINLTNRLGYLVNYPHGCIEQTTSSVFPQMHLAALMELNKQQQDEISRNVKAGIERIQRFQTSDGGFSYWPGESYTDNWGTNYAGHFLLEAELAGYRLPERMKERWIAYQSEQAKQWTAPGSTSATGHFSDGYYLTQAYRLYLLALAKSPETGAMNRLRESPNLPELAKWRLASAYAMIGHGEIADQLVQKTGGVLQRYREHDLTYGSDLRDKAIILEVNGILRNQKKELELYTELADVLSSDKWLSTQETGYMLMAMAKTSKAHNTAVSKLFYSVDGGKGTEVNIGRQIKNVVIPEKQGSRKVKLKNTGKTRLYLTVVTEKIALPGNERKRASKLELSVYYHDMNGKTLDPSKIKQGTEFVAEVTVRNPGKKMHYKQMALNQIFPSGWEIRNTRMYSAGLDSDARYQDFRDDRVLSYYNLDAGKSKVIRVVLHATYQGKFYLPAATSEAMYDHSIFALEPGKWVEVERQ